MLTLNSPIGTNCRVDPDDLMNTKQAIPEFWDNISLLAYRTAGWRAYVM